VEFEWAPYGKQYSAWLEPDLPVTYKVMEEVLAELAGLFPGPYLHIAGDEPFGMPEDLYIKYLSRMRPYVLSLGKRSVGFQGSIRAIADPGHVIQYWMHTHPPSPGAPAAKRPPMVEENVRKSRSDVEQAVAHSIPILVSPATNTYLDAAYAESSLDPAQEALRERVGQRVYRPRTIAETFPGSLASPIRHGAIRRA
jgi:hexosaminidase